ncbi:MAG TPA: hypothetical protein VJ853_02885 [Thermoanaerobaculia bacterium]|nr:hypothetical protein [Thermoanaerobaculia bacterium]
MQKIVSLIAFLAAPALFAQPLTVGSMPNDANFGLGGTYATSAPYSIVDIAHPATSNGTVSRASVMWSFTCAGAFKLAFLRPGNSPSALTVTAVRGPFDATTGRVDVPLSPPVNVQAGDLIALVQLKEGTSCGGPFFGVQPSGQSAVWLSLNDISTTGTLASTATLETQLAFAVMAYDADPVLVRVVPAAGAVQGNGAFFRTSLQIFNDSSTVPVTGKLVFHRASTAGSDSDPSLPFTVGVHQTLSFPDVVAAMNINGLGSLDVFTNGGQALVVSARVFSDNGDAGTSGFTEEGRAPAEALRQIPNAGNIDGVLLVPSDLTNFRMNVGVRSLGSGATLTITTFDRSGTKLSSRSNAYPADYFEQVPATQFTGLSALPAGGSIVVSVQNGGSAFVYGSITDNRTQDSSMRMAEER